MTRVFDGQAPPKLQIDEVTLANGYADIPLRSIATVKDVTIHVQEDNALMGAEQLLGRYVLYGDAVAGVNLPNVDDIELFRYSVDGNGATGTSVAFHDAPFDGEITRVELSFATNGVTGTNTVDVHVAGTTIFTTASNRPSIAHDDTDGIVAVARTIEAGTFSQADRITIDVDSVATGTAPTDILVRVYGKYKPYHPDTGEISRIVLRAATTGNDSLSTIQYCRVYDDSGASFTNEDTAIRDATDNDVELFNATPALSDVVYIGADVPFRKFTMVQGTDAVWDVGITWYYSSSATEADWNELTVTDGSSDFTDVNGTTITWTLPTDWVTDSIDSQTAYWIKAVITTFTSLTTAPQLASADIGISAVVDVNIAGTTIYTTQGNRAVLHDDTTNGADEVEGGRLTSTGVVNTSGIAAGSFTRNQNITVDIDYACPSTGTEPVDLEVMVFGSYDNYGQKETFNWKTGDTLGRYVTVFSDNLASATPLKVTITGY